MTAAEAIAVMALTLLLVVARSHGLNEGLAALAGALLVLALRLVPVGEALRLILSDWNVFLFFLGMMATAALADQSGVFDFTAYTAGRLSGGRVVLLPKFRPK